MSYEVRKQKEELIKEDMLLPRDSCNLYPFSGTDFIPKKDWDKYGLK